MAAWNRSWRTARAQLLLVGASVRAAAASARRAGYAPLAIDLFADADLAGCCHVQRWDYQPDTLITIAKRLPHCPWLYTGALENRPHLVESLAAARPLYGNHLQVLTAVRDPWKLAATLRRHGFNAAAVTDRAAHQPRGNWINKPLHSAGGEGVFRWEGRRSDSQTVLPTGYLQQYVPGPSYAAVYVGSDERTVLLGITRQLVGAAWVGARGFRYAGSIGPIRPRARVQQEFQRLGSVLSREFGLRGLFGIDVVVNDQGIWPLEVNPRYTASVEILERAGSLDSIRYHVAACVDGAMPTRNERGADRSFGKAILYARHRIAITEDFSRLVARRNAGQRWPAVADIPATGSTVREGRPVTTVFAEAETVELVEGKLRRRARELQDVLGC